MYLVIDTADASLTSVRVADDDILVEAEAGLIKLVRMHDGDLQEFDAATGEWQEVEERC